MANTKTNRKLWVVRCDGGHVEILTSRSVARDIAKWEGGKVVPIELTTAQTKILNSLRTPK